MKLRIQKDITLTDIERGMESEESNGGLCLWREGKKDYFDYIQ